MVSALQWLASPFHKFCFCFFQTCVFRCSSMCSRKYFCRFSLDSSEIDNSKIFSTEVGSGSFKEETLPEHHHHHPLLQLLWNPVCYGRAIFLWSEDWQPSLHEQQEQFVTYCKISLVCYALYVCFAWFVLVWPPLSYNVHYLYLWSPSNLEVLWYEVLHCTTKSYIELKCVSFIFGPSSNLETALDHCSWWPEGAEWLHLWRSTNFMFIISLCCLIVLQQLY